jgi:ankyrin repeat protein
VLLLAAAAGCAQSRQQGTKEAAALFDEAYAKRVHEETALHIAVSLDDRARIERLLAEGADIEARTDYGATPLAFAVSHASDKRTFDLLVAKGANIRTLDNDKSSLLHEAAACGKREIAEFLLAQKLDPNAKTTYGRTPLHTAVFNAQRPLAELLLASGVDVDAGDAIGATPLHYGVEMACLYDALHGNSYLDVLELLLGRGADVQAEVVKDPPMTSGKPSRIRAGDTPLSIALRYARSDLSRAVVSLLKKHGATE